MLREMVIKLFCFLAYIPDKINYLRVGRIKFIYITTEVMHYTCLLSVIFKDNLKNWIVYWHLYAYADDDTLFVSGYK